MVLELIGALDHHEIMRFTLIGQATFAVCYMISALFVASNSYAGFNALAQGLVQFAVIALSFYGLFKEVTRTLYGIVLGAAVILIFLSLQSAIFWGQYSSCSFVSMTAKDGYLSVECDHQSAMKSVCAFSVFMFLSYCVQVAAMIRYKNDLLGAAPANEAVGKGDGIPSFSDFHMRASPAPAPIAVPTVANYAPVPGNYAPPPSHGGSAHGYSQSADL